MNRLSDIAVFVQVVESASFTSAADRLDLSRAAVSKAVSRLEVRLGARLLNRSTRRLSLTEAGSGFYRRSREALASLDEAESEVGRMQSEPRGTLRITGPVYFGVHHLGPVIAEFLATFPAVRADVHLDDHFVNIVEEGFDVAIRVSALKDSSLVSRKLAPCRNVVCASPDYWAGHGTPREPEDLARHNCFLYNNLSSPHLWQFVGPDDRRTTVQVHGSLRFNNTEMARRAVIHGLGVIRLPTFYVGDDIRAGRLEPVLADYRMARDISVYAVYPSREQLPAKVRLFIDLLAERFGPEPYWDRF